MRWTWPQPRFGLRSLLLLVMASAVAVWLYFSQPNQLRVYRDHQAQKRIDPYELSIIRGVERVPQGLVTILGDSRLKHWNKVGAVMLLSGNQLATCGRDERIRIWNTLTGRQLHDLEGNSLTTSGDRKLAFFAAADGTIRCWDVAQAKVIKTLGSPAAVDRVGMASNADGSRLVVELAQRDWSREIIVWNVAESLVIHRFRPDTQGGGALSLTADGKFFTWEKDSRIQLTECETLHVLRQIGPIADESGRYSLGQVSLSADQTKLFVGNASDSVVVFDWASGQEIHRIGPASASVHTFAIGRGENAVAFGGQSSLLIYTRFGDKWRFWESDRRFAGQLGTVDWREQTIAAGNGNDIRLWDSSSSILPARVDNGSPTAITRLAFHPNGRYLLTGDADGQVAQWDVRTWGLVRRWPAHSRPIETLVVSANGKRLVTASSDRTVAMWDATTGKEICVLRDMHQPRGVGISPDGKQIVAVSRGHLFRDDFEIFEADNGKSIEKAGPIKHGIISRPAWSRDGERLAFIDQSQSLQIFDTSPWKSLTSLGKTRFAQQEVVAAWFADNQRLVTTNWGKDEVHILDIGKTRPLLTINAGGGHAECVALHPSERWIAVCGANMPVQIWQLPTATLVKAWQLGPLHGLVSQVAFSPDGHYLATVNGNGTVYVLSLDGLLK